MAAAAQPTPAALTPGADAVKAIAGLVRPDHVSVEFRPLPAEALGAGTFAKTPHVAVVRRGEAVEIISLGGHIQEARGKPWAKIGTARAETLDSFIALVNRHKVVAESVVFGNPDWRRPTLTAVLDYHAGAANVEQRDAGVALEDAAARFGRHRVHYAYPLSDAWKAWVEANGRKMTQADFAAFLEDHITDLAAPEEFERQNFERDFKAKFATPAELIDLSRGLEVLVGARVKNRVRLDTGETQMVFEVQHTDGQGNELVVPGLFLLSVAPFHRGEVIRIPCRLRYRAGGSDIVWFFEMIQPDRFIDERLIDDMDRVGRETGLPTFAGGPEMSGS